MDSMLTPCCLKGRKLKNRDKNFMISTYFSSWLLADSCEEAIEV